MPIVQKKKKTIQKRRSFIPFLNLLFYVNKKLCSVPWPADRSSWSVDKATSSRLFFFLLTLNSFRLSRRQVKGWKNITKMHIKKTATQYMEKLQVSAKQYYTLGFRCGLDAQIYVERKWTKEIKTKQHVPEVMIFRIQTNLP